MKKYSAELYVGIFVLIGLLCVSYLTVRLGKMDFFSHDGYTVYANFGSINGLRSGAEVQISGVSIGKVSGIELNNDFRARVYLKINEGVHLPDDTGASVKTSGLIGDKYISLSPGGASVVLANNDEITDTQDAVDIEALISKYVFGSVK